MFGRIAKTLLQNPSLEKLSWVAGFCYPDLICVWKIKLVSKKVDREHMNLQLVKWTQLYDREILDQIQLVKWTQLYDREILRSNAYI